MDTNQNNQGGPNQGKPQKPKGVWTALIITLVLVLMFSWIFNMVAKSQYRETTFSDFLQAMDNNDLAEVEFKYDRIVYMTKKEAMRDPAMQKASFTGMPRGGDQLELAERLHGMGVKVNGEITEDNSVIMMLLYYVLSFAVLFFFMRMLTKRMKKNSTAKDST